MIEEYYGLDIAPFRLIPDPRFFFRSGTHGKALAYLRYGLQQGEGFIVLTGDVGTGKSTLIAHLLSEVDPARVVSSNLATSNLDPHDALKVVAETLGLTLSETVKKADILVALTGFVSQQRQAGRTVLLIVDEVQNMPRASLEELRMLTDATSDHKGGLQCFLVGQSQFRATLSDPAMEQLRQRVIGSCHLEPMTIDETRDYINHRLKVSGWRDRPAIAEGVPALIQAATGGVPRRINMLFSRLLVHGAVEERDHLGERDCRAVIDDLAAEFGDIKVVPMSSGNGQVPADLSRLEQRLDAVEDILVELLETTASLLERRTVRQPNDNDAA